MHKLAVKLEGLERRKRSASWIHVAAGCFMLVKSMDYIMLYESRPFVAALPFIVTGCLALLYGVLKKVAVRSYRFNSGLRIMESVMFASFAFLFFPAGRKLDVYVLFAWAILCFFLFFAERKLFREPALIFNNDGILFPGFMSDISLLWGSITEVVVRPDYVTVFRNNNTYLQYEVLKKLDPAILDNISLYCQQQLLTSGKVALN